MPSSCEQCKASECFLTCPTALAQGPSVNLWRWWAKSSPPSWRSRDPLPEGPIVFGGGGKSKKAKKPPKKDICLSPWVADYK